MKCDDCKQQPAAIHLTQIVNGQKTELHLCFACANKKSIQIFPVAFGFQAAIPPGVVPAAASELGRRVCSNCGYTWQEFINTGFLGCTVCYKSFEDLLTQLIAQNYGNVRHQGKYPQKGGAPIRLRREIASLRNELDAAVKQENFEKAVEIRDRIKALERQQTGVQT